MSPFQHDARATAQVWSEELARLVYVVDIDDGRAVAVEFDAPLVGIRAVHMTRIGGAVRLAD